MFAVLGFTILLHITVLSNLNFLPYPELFVYPYLTNKGLLPYVQILDQHFPGVMFLPINLDNLGMHTPADARVVQFAVVITVHIMLYFVARRLFGSNLKALASNFLYLVWQPYFEGWVLWIDSFLPVFYLLAFHQLLVYFDNKKKKHLIIVSLALGAATIFKQVVIPLVVLLCVYLYLKRRNLNEIYYFLAWYMLLPLVMVSYLFLAGVFSNFWHWTVVFNLTTFAAMGRKYVSLPELIRVGFVFSFLFLGLVYKKDRRHFILIAVFVVGSAFAAYARFDFVHLQPALPFVILGTVGVLTKTNSIQKLLIAVYLAGSLFILRGFLQSHTGNRVFFFERNEIQISEKIRVLASPGEKIFLFGVTPNIYQMTGTLPAGDIFVFQFPWFVVESETRLLEGLARDRPRVVVADREVTIQGAKITDYASKINRYILENYVEVDRVGSGQIFLKK
ncbi:hypothetical protein A2125_00275 [Candidatus Woesebacteria bacterium GWB1_43_5]|uniref:Glycosyltransferase RgtA/B/C/D-like domain-containing protein n=1 Tax=Candidatus Woesebacteria bacterium GWB1_43_5 TaxID=1802474 RepID=A0A1F7WSM9_9BACT|nr:MAG: hypothetical protein A2125_00275 [Candidatus Woesebacteria bacterium GWB1_43_5]